MKKNKLVILLSLTLMLLVNNIVKADEGMWAPMLIGKNYAQMKKQGFKLTPKDLYDINKASLKDAIVSFGGFCTGEMVSKNGLVFTNHHCGYDAITSNSTPQDNILDNGFYAKNHAEEKPIPGLFVNFLVKMEDVTQKVLDATKGLDGEAKANKIAELSSELSEKAKAGTHYDAFVRDFFKGNQYFLYVFEKYTDVRLVGNPPQSIGKFGGDTDNWEWPRHTGDFAIFRVYAGKDNKPAEYSIDNIPFTPKKYLPLSIKGVENGDFAMIYGFPGRTDRFLTSYGVSLSTDSVGPELVKLRDIRLKAWKEQMDKDLSFRLKISSTYARIANYWKYYIGQGEQLKRLKIYEEKQKNEAEFTKWAADKPEYASIMTKYEAAYKAYAPYAVHRTFFNEGFLATSWVRLNNTAKDLILALENTKTNPVAHAKIKSSLEVMLNEYETTYNEAADKKIFAEILNAFYTDIPKNQHPKFYTTILEDYWAGSPEATFNKYADVVWEKSNLIKPEKLKAFWARPSLAVLEKDPAYLYAKNLIISEYVKANFETIFTDFEKTKADLDHLYLQALLAKNKNQLIYPDANSTMRISYGNVQDYSPKDGILYQTTTSIDGMIRKYIAGDDEFDLPKNLLEAYEAKNYGRYGKDGQLVVNFITNNDITGGNSGSPVINGKGELIGLAFDGNWEAMSGDIAFDKNYKRSINVDIRYVLWCIEILGGAHNIISELDIRTK